MGKWGIACVGVRSKCGCECNMCVYYPQNVETSIIQACVHVVSVSPCGKPSHTSSQSYLQSPSPTSRGSFSRSKVRKLRVMSMWGGAMIM